MIEDYKQKGINLEFERRNDNLEFCSTKCPHDFKNIGIGGCERRRENVSYKRLQCASDKVEYGSSLGLCYNDCNVTAGTADIINGKVVKKPGQESNNYTMQSAGLCAQECPPGSTDFGVGCTRQAFDRGVGIPGWSMRAKKRRIPYSTKKSDKTTVFG